MIQEQLGNLSQTTFLTRMPVPEIEMNVSLLGNRSIQVAARAMMPVDSPIVYHELPLNAQPELKLSLLKRQRFAASGRRQRIAAALAAINSPQPTDLTLSQWKEIAEEVENED
jgi:hypothetical protein